MNGIDAPLYIVDEHLHWDLDRALAATTWTNADWKQRARQLRAHIRLAAYTKARTRARRRAIHTAYRHRTLARARRNRR